VLGPDESLASTTRSFPYVAELLPAGGVGRVQGHGHVRSKPVQAPERKATIALFLDTEGDTQDVAAPGFDATAASQ
jgi:hypothetical protein